MGHGTGMLFAHTGKIDAVEVTDMPPDPDLTALLRALAAAGFADPVAHGGALRDRYIGRAAHIADYDVWAQFGTTHDNPARATPQHFAKIIMAALPGATIVENPPLSHTTSRSQSWGKIAFIYDGKRVDLFMTSVPFDLEARALAADATLNAVAMDAAGRILAHPDFAAHARGRLYVPLPGIEDCVAAARFNHLRARIPGLRRPPPAAGPVAPNP